MRIDAAVVRALLRPAWVGLILGATLLAAFAALWVGLQQQPGEQSTTFVFARRVGFLNQPLPVLDDHLNEIVNSVEFPVVFERIEDRLLLQEGRDYDLSVGVVEGSDSLVEVEVRTQRQNDADRIARIVAEEMVLFVLLGLEVDATTEIDGFESDLAVLREEQDRLISLSGGIRPDLARNTFQAQLTGVGPVGAAQSDLRDQLDLVAPLAIDYERNESTIRGIQRQRVQAVGSQLDISSSLRSINQEWYRLITPVEETSNLPIAIAMAFAAGVPALVAATALAGLNVARRLHRDERAEQEPRSARIPAGVSV